MYSWVLQNVRRTASSDKRFLSKAHFQILTEDIFFWTPFNKLAQFDEEEFILGPNDDENLAVNNTVTTDVM